MHRDWAGVAVRARIGATRWGRTRPGPAGPRREFDGPVIGTTQT